MGYDFFTFVGVNPAAAFVEITYDFKYWINPAVVDHVDYINYDPSDPTKKQYFLGPGNWDTPDPSWLNNAWEQTVDVEVQSVSTMLSVKDVRQDVMEPEDGLPAIFVSKQIDEDTLKQFFAPVVNLPPTSTLGFMFSTTSNPLTEDPDRLHPYLPFIPVCGFWRNYFGMDVDVGQLTIFDSVGTATMVTVTFVVMGLVMNLGLDNYFGGGGDYSHKLRKVDFRGSPPNLVKRVLFRAGQGAAQMGIGNALKYRLYTVDITGLVVPAGAVKRMKTENDLNLLNMNNC